MTPASLSRLLNPAKFTTWQTATRLTASFDAVCYFTAGLRSGGCLTVVAPTWAHVAAALSSGSLLCDEAARVAPESKRFTVTCDAGDVASGTPLRFTGSADAAVAAAPPRNPFYPED